VRELLALGTMHVRSSVRGRGVRAGLVIFVLGTAATLALPDAAVRGTGLALMGSLFVLLLLVTGLAVGAGRILPEERVAGREAWLAALAPASWKRRLAVVLAAWTLAAGLGAAGGLLLGIVLPLVRPGVMLRAHEPVALPSGAVLATGAAPTALVLSPDAGGRTLEIDVRPLFSRASRVVPVDRVAVAWSARSRGKAAPIRGVLKASARGPLRLTLPAGTSAVRLALRTRHVRLRLTQARRLGAARPTALVLSWTGLLLGLLAGAVAPVAVLVSRGTTGQTASAAALCFLLFGATRGAFVTLAADLDPQGPMALAVGLLRALGGITPDVPILRVVGEAAALRAPGMAAAAWLGPVLAYTVIVTLLACVPVPRRLRAGVNG